MQNSETVTSVTLTPNAAGLSATTAAGAAYTVTPSAATGTINPNNYTITYNAYNGTVATALLTVTATGPSKTYGTALTTGTSTANFTATGMQNSETVTSVTLTPNAAGLSATTAAGAAYAVAPSTATGTINANNYTITYNAYNGTVGTAALTVTAMGPSKTYGTALTTGTSTANFTATGMQNSETVTSVTLTPNAAGLSATTAAGAAYAVAPSTATGTINANNYTITYNAYNGTVGAAELKVTANAQNKTYGQILTFGSGSTQFTATGLQNGETIGSVTLGVSGNGGAATAAVGSYTITPSAATGGTFNAGNYSITYATGLLTVVPLPLMASHSSVGYQSPGTCVVFCNVTYATNTSLLLLVLEPSLPPGWTLLSASGDGSPEVNSGEIFFNGSLPSPLNFTYTASVPAGQTGPYTIQDINIYWLSGMTSFTNTLAAPNPLVVNYGAILALSVHSNQLSLTLFGASGSNYVLQASTNLVNWSNVATIVPVNGVIQTNEPMTGSKMFYRAMFAH
jgi:hypothetical protein